MKEMDEGWAGQAVTLTVGEQMRVTLRETGSTGFRWSGGGTCGAVLHLDTERAVPPKDATPGASGERIWIYTAAKEGTCELTYASVRSWENAAGGKTISYQVTVGK